MLRLLRGLGALFALVLGLVGIPVALVLLGGNPLTADVSWSSVRHVLLRRDDGSVLLGLLTLIGWVAWSLFAISLLTEMLNACSGYRLHLRIPGLGEPQRLIAGLMLTVATSLAGPLQSVQAAPLPMPHHSTDVSGRHGSAARTDATAQLQARPPVLPPAASDGHLGTTAAVASAAFAKDPGLTHVVTRGDDLWSLAQHYYGQGRNWRKIASANPKLLSGGPDRLQVGWRLRIPDAEPPEQVQPDAVVVHAGDSLSSIAEETYGQASRWHDIYAANRDLLDDPDEIDVGTRLELPRLDAAAETKNPSGHEDEGSPVQQPPATRSHSTTTSDSSTSDSSTKSDPSTKDDSAKADGPRQADSSEPSTTRPERRSPEGAPSTQLERPATPVPTRPATAPPATVAQPTLAAPREAQPTQVVSTAVQPPPVTSTADRGDRETQEDAHDTTAEAALGVLSVGGLLAAAVLGGLSWRRRIQLQSRPVGRRLAHPAAAAQAVETALGHRQTPLSLDTLDLAMRAVAAHARHSVTGLPPLTLAKVGPDLIELVMSGPASDPPVGFQVSGRSWLLDRDDAHYLSSSPEVAGAVRPYPALVSLGFDDAGNQVLADLESSGLLALEPERPELAEALLAAMAVELSFSPWADELVLTLVGTFPELPDALGHHNVTRTEDLNVVLDRLERRAEAQRAHALEADPRQSRLDPDLADPWTPEILLVSQHLSLQQGARLAAVTTAPRLTMAAVVAEPTPDAPWTLSLRSEPADQAEHVRGPGVVAQLQPLGLRLLPQLLPPPARRAVVELLATTGTEETTPAPWWDHGDDPPDAGQPPDNVTYLGRRFGGWGGDTSERGEGSGVETQEQQEAGGASRHHPVLRLLGPVELSGATGTLPPRAGKQCLEYCGWLLEHPGTTAQAMASALVVAEGTRRSNMSRLRTWLGADAQGQPYLPDAYTGRILLHESVSSDWQRLQILTAAGVNRTSTGGLRAALELVRGAPLADAAPGQWHWAEELRTDMISVIRDIGVELASRAVGDHDIDLARWAAARALAAAPGDELLLAVRIRTEHQAGNEAETERLTLQLAAHARSLGVDLDSDTVVLMQEVMEGRVRSRIS